MLVIIFYHHHIMQHLDKCCNYDKLYLLGGSDKAFRPSSIHKCLLFSRHTLNSSVESAISPEYSMVLLYFRCSVHFNEFKIFSIAEARLHLAVVGVAGNVVIIIIVVVLTNISTF